MKDIKMKNGFKELEEYCNNSDISLLEEQLAAAKAEIAEYRKLLNVIATIGDERMAKRVNAVLAKHKGE